MMLKMFYPYEYVDSAFSIDYEKLVNFSKVLLSEMATLCNDMNIGRNIK